MLHDDNDHFWRMYNDEYDYEYFQQHQEDYQRGRGRRHHWGLGLFSRGYGGVLRY